MNKALNIFCTYGNEGIFIKIIYKSAPLIFFVHFSSRDSCQKLVKIKYDKYTHKNKLPSYIKARPVSVLFSSINFVPLIRVTGTARQPSDNVHLLSKTTPKEQTFITYAEIIWVYCLRLREMEKFTTGTRATKLRFNVLKKNKTVFLCSRTPRVRLLRANCLNSDPSINEVPL